MSRRPHHDRPPSDRLAELRVGRALGSLAAEEVVELDTLCAGPDLPDDYELAAAAAYLALADDPEPLPAGLRQRLELDLERLEDA